MRPFRLYQPLSRNIRPIRPPWKVKCAPECDTRRPSDLRRGLSPSCSIFSGDDDVGRTPLRARNRADPPGMWMGLVPRPLARPLGLLALGPLRPELVSSLPPPDGA